jgi:CRP/FNR family transcriptional regulator, dissimilatory nitrate respiration regulator
MIKKDDFRTACNSRLFRGVPHGFVKTIIGAATPRRYQKYDNLFMQDDPIDCIFIVLDGWAKVFRNTIEGEDAVFGVSSAGEVLAISAMFDRRTYVTSAEAATDVRILPISVQALCASFQKVPELSTNIMNCLSHDTRELSADLEKMKCSSASQRVIDFLLEHCPVQEGPAIVSLPYDKSLIARQLGMQPESFSRILGKLVRLGVKVVKNRIQIAEVGALSSTPFNDYTECKQLTAR